MAHSFNGRKKDFQSFNRSSTLLCATIILVMKGKTMNSNDKMMFVVRDLNILIKEYGLAQIKHALSFIENFPATPVVKQNRFKNTIGADFYLSDEELKRIDSLNPRVNKIQAIKMFREITSCGLKEAKDAIEDYYKISLQRAPW